MRAKILAILGFFAVPLAIVFPVLNYQDQGLNVMTIEGSGSLFEPIQFLTQGNPVKAEISVLPTGSAGGKEALDNGDSVLALTSLSEEKSSSPSTSQLKEVRLSDDPIVLIYKEGTKCSLFDKDKNNQGQNNSDLLNKLFENTKECGSLTLFLREGYRDRSNLNKTVLATDQSISSDSKIHIEEVPENNFLALHKFSLESDLNAVIFFPTSFYEQNKDLFTKLGYKALKLGKKTTKQTNSPKLQKELSLLFKWEAINDESNLKQLITYILSQAEKLKEKFNLESKTTKTENLFKDTAKN